MDTQPFIIAIAVSFLLMILGSVTGSVLRSRFGITIEDPGSVWISVTVIFYLLLFLVTAFSLVPIVLHLFISMQIRIGNGDLMLVEKLAANESMVVYGIWGLFAAGLAIALPAAARSRLFR